VGLSVPHQLEADEADGGVVWSCLHCLLWAVLPAEAPGGKRKGVGEVGSTGAFPGGSEEGRVQRSRTNFIVLVEEDQGQH